MAKKYLESWKKAKDQFEKTTGKKKPDPKSRFGKLFSKISSTGLEKALKAYDDAKTIKDAEKNAVAFNAAVKAYLPTLDAAATAARQDGDKVYADACGDMVQALNKISANVVMDLERFASRPKTMEGVFRSPYWFKVMKKQAKKELSLENVELYDLIINKKLKTPASIREAYDTYIDPKAPKQVNIGSSTLALCKKAISDGDLTKMPWDKLKSDLATNLGDTLMRAENEIVAGNTP